MVEIVETLKHLNNFWLGYRYTVIGMPGEVSASSLLDAAGLATLGISEVVFPTANVELFKVPSLSTVDRYIPKKLSHTELVLRAPTFRNTAFWDRIEKQILSLQDPTEYDSVPETIMVVEFDIRPGPSHVALEILSGFAPLCVWIMRGAQASSITPARASVSGSDSVPLEELRLQVDSLERL